MPFWIILYGRMSRIWPLIEALLFTQTGSVQGGGYLMDGDTVLVVHLVQLINEADASVSQHQRPTLQRPFPGEWILLDCCCQTHCRCTLACATHSKHHIKS